MSATVAPIRMNICQMPSNHICVSFDQTDNKTTPCPIMSDIFHRGDERLKTFENWGLPWLDAKVLAETGMFYTGEDDKVKCYFCEVEIGRWEKEDLPVPEHLRWSPNCPLLRRRTTNNIPINAEEFNCLLPQLSYDICGANDSTAVPSNDSGATFQQRRMGNGMNNTSTAAAIQPVAFYPEYPEYAIETARLRSFNNWPRDMKQTPEQMAEAGFFYTDIGDRVNCFSCGGGLKDWNQSDDPWEQHALWLPKCRFVKLVKGQCFIETVAAKFKLMSVNISNSIIQQQLHQQQQQLEQQQQQQLQHQQQYRNNNDSEKPNCSSNNETTSRGVSVSTSTSTSTSMETLTTSLSTQTLDDMNMPSDRTETEKCMTPRSATTATSATTTSINTNNIPEEKLCKICYANEYNTAFLPCGHVVACVKCASSVTKCPMCRKPYTDVTRVFFS